MAADLDLRKIDEKAITNLQAHVRGAFVRSKLDEVRQEFENIVHELDGPSFRVLWNSKTLSFPLVTNNIEKDEEIPTFDRQTGKNEEIETAETSSDDQDQTITLENVENLNVSKDKLTHNSYTESVRQNLEGRFDMAHTKDIEWTVSKEGKRDPLNDVDTLSEDSSDFASAKDFEMSKHNLNAKDSEYENAKDSGSGKFHPIKDSGYLGVSGSIKNDAKTAFFEDAKDLDNVKDFESTRNQENPNVSVKTKDSGHSIAKDHGYLHAKDSGSNTTSVNCQSGMTSPVFLQHSTPVPTQNTRINRHLEGHPVLTESWMTDKSFDPVRSDEASSISDLSVSDLQHRREQVSMELLWTQQAIESRKNYLRLKKKIEQRTDSE